MDPTVVVIILTITLIISSKIDRQEISIDQDRLTILMLLAMMGNVDILLILDKINRNLRILEVMIRHNRRIQDKISNLRIREIMISNKRTIGHSERIVKNLIPAHKDTQFIIVLLLLHLPRLLEIAAAVEADRPIHRHVELYQIDLVADMRIRRDLPPVNEEEINIF